MRANKKFAYVTHFSKEISTHCSNLVTLTVHSNNKEFTIRSPLVKEELYCDQGFIQGLVGGALVPPPSSAPPLEKPLTQRSFNLFNIKQISQNYHFFTIKDAIITFHLMDKMKRCNIVPAPLRIYISQIGPLACKSCMKHW